MQVQTAQISRMIRWVLVVGGWWMVVDIVLGPEALIRPTRLAGSKEQYEVYGVY